MNASVDATAAGKPSLNASQTLLSNVLALPSASEPRSKRRKTSHASTPRTLPAQTASKAHTPSASLALKELDDGGAAAASELASHLHRVHDGTTLVLTNPARPRPLPSPASKEGRKLKKRDRRVADRLGREERRGKAGVKQAGSSDALQGQEKNSGGDARTAANEPLARAEKKRLGFLDKHPNLSYETIKPLASLWESYVQLLLGLRTESGEVNAGAMHFLFEPDGDGGASVVRDGAMTGLQTTLSKVDLTGASVRVTRCSDPARVGLAGLVARETENTLLIVVAPAPQSFEANRSLPPTESQAQEALRQRRAARPLSPTAGKKDSVRVVPKHNTVFELLVPLPFLPTKTKTTSTSSEVDSSAGVAQPRQQMLAVPLYGNQMSQNFPTRATKKHKARKSVDF